MVPTPQRAAGPGGLRRVARIARAVLSVNRALLTDRAARRRILTAVKPPADRPPAGSLAPAQQRAVATPYDGLNQRSTTLCGLHFDDRPPCLNLVLRELDPRAV